MGVGAESMTGDATKRMDEDEPRAGTGAPDLKQGLAFLPPQKPDAGHDEIRRKPAREANQIAGLGGSPHDPELRLILEQMPDEAEKGRWRDGHEDGELAQAGPPEAKIRT